MQGRKVLKILICLTVLTAGLLFVQTVFAQIEPGINAVNAEIALPSEDPRIIAAKIIRAALGFLGIIALAIVLYGGFVWMTSAGNEEKIDKAKKILTNAVIGLVIILMAFGITQWVLNALVGRYAAPSYGTPTGPPVIGRYSGALGNGIVESHYPPRGGTGIARNTKIIVTFKEKMLLESIIEGYDDNNTLIPTSTLPDPRADDKVGGVAITSATIFPLKSANIKIYISDPDVTGGGETTALTPTQVKVTFTPDLKTFVFDPVEYLGSASQNIWYTVALKPGLQFVDERGQTQNAFGADAFREGYAWDFETSTIIDTTPPQVEITWPPFRDPTLGEPLEEVPRNTVVQINFDEAIDPTTITLENIPVSVVGGAAITGTWTISNQYKTAEFVSDRPCEGVSVNSCGQPVYCLPATSLINVLAKAATLSIEEPPNPPPPEAESPYPYDGITDVAGNSLNGRKDLEFQGSDLDDARFLGNDHYGVNFRTTGLIDLTPPVVEDVSPAPMADEVRLDAPVTIMFSKRMMTSTFNSENIILEDNQRDECAVWYAFYGQGVNDDGSLPTEAQIRAPGGWSPRKHKAIISHGDFIASGTTPAPTCSDNNPINPTRVDYFPRATQRVRDLTQNCFFPPEGPGIPPASGECSRNPDGTMPSGCPWEPPE